MSDRKSDIQLIAEGDEEMSLPGLFQLEEALFYSALRAGITTREWHGLTQQSPTPVGCTGGLSDRRDLVHSDPSRLPELPKGTGACHSAVYAVSLRG